ncbi:MAG: universal stress protein [Candidatus Caldarchaeum sp.]
MIKVLIAVDSDKYFYRAVHLLLALKFKEWEAHLVHVLEPFFPFGTAVAPEMEIALAMDYARIQESATQHAQAILQSAQDQLNQAKVKTSPHLLTGHVSETLIRFAETEACDLIALGSEKKGALGALFYGSTTRSVATNATTSLLIAKKDHEPGKPLKVLFATDHSPYSERCVKTLERLAPQGISHLTILTAYQTEATLPEMAFSGIPQAVEENVQAHLSNLNSITARRLNELGEFSWESLVIKGDPIPTIRKTMEETGADLLILGAKGKSAVERFLLGSVSHHFIVSEPFSLLLLR